MSVHRRLILIAGLVVSASTALAQGGPPAMPVSISAPVAKRVTQWDEYSGRFEAVAVVENYRRHPYWMLLGFDPDSVGLHDELWPLAAGKAFARRRIYDARLALSLRRQGVTEFATANVKDFQGFGFDRVWNPLES